MFIWYCNILIEKKAKTKFDNQFKINKILNKKTKDIFFWKVDFEL